MRFYLYRDHQVVKIGEGDELLQASLKGQGYQLLSPLATREEARIAQQMWQEQIDNRREQGLL